MIQNIDTKEFFLVSSDFVKNANAYTSSIGASN